MKTNYKKPKYKKPKNNKLKRLMQIPMRSGKSGVWLAARPQYEKRKQSI